MNLKAILRPIILLIYMIVQLCVRKHGDEIFAIHFSNNDVLIACTIYHHITIMYIAIHCDAYACSWISFASG